MNHLQLCNDLLCKCSGIIDSLHRVKPMNELLKRFTHSPDEDNQNQQIGKITVAETMIEPSITLMMPNSLTPMS